MSTGDRYGLHDSLGYWVNRAAGTMHAAFDQEIQRHGVTAAQWAVLITVYQDDAATAGEIAKRIGIDQSAVTRLLDRMEEKGLVNRRPHPSDRRALRAELTDKARALVPELVRISKTINAEFISRLPRNERTRFLEQLQILAREP